MGARRSTDTGSSLVFHQTFGLLQHKIRPVRTRGPTYHQFPNLRQKLRIRGVRVWVYLVAGGGGIVVLSAPMGLGAVLGGQLKSFPGCWLGLWQSGL